MSAQNREFLDSLKQEHVAAVGLLKQAKEAHAAGRYDETSRLLGTLKGALGGHLKKEDDKLYRELKSAAEAKKDTMALATMTGFSSTMGRIAQKAVAFLDAYTVPGAIQKDARGFGSQLDFVTTTLANRMQSEEKVLYPLYEKNCC